MNPIIGITSSNNSNGDYFLRRKYCSVILKSGGIPLILPPVGRPRAVLGIVNGILLSGGGDIAPRLCGIADYDPARLVDPSPERDEYELELARLAFDHGMPVLGICRGMQIMNVSLGGTLCFDISHHMQSRSHEQPSHSVSITNGSLLRRLVCTDTLEVNSFHHQAVSACAKVLCVSAVAEDGQTEAVEAADRHFFLGVQWHPEHMNTHASNVLFAGLCAAAIR